MFNTTRTDHEMRNPKTNDAERKAFDAYVNAELAAKPWILRDRFGFTRFATQSEAAAVCKLGQTIEHSPVSAR